MRDPPASYKEREPLQIIDYQHMSWQLMRRQGYGELLIGMVDPSLWIIWGEAPKNSQVVSIAHHLGIGFGWPVGGDCKYTFKVGNDIILAVYEKDFKVSQRNNKFQKAGSR